jgi:hypothetical protein
MVVKTAARPPAHAKAVSICAVMERMEREKSRRERNRLVVDLALRKV